MKKLIQTIVLLIPALILFGCGGGSTTEPVVVSDVTATLSPANGVSDVLAASTVTATFTSAAAGSGTTLITIPGDWGSVFTLVEVGGDGTNLCASALITFAENAATCAPGGLRGLQYTMSISGLTDASGNTISDASATFSVTHIPGDFNGDGYGDLIVGAMGANIGSPSASYIYFGSSAGLDLTTRVTFSGQANARFGEAVSIRGDFNGDGFSDALIGNPRDGTNGTDEVYLFYGLATPSDTSIPDVSFTDGGGTDKYGHAVTAGDFNGDGYDDVVIGADSANSYAGRVYIYYGSTAMDAVADVTIDGIDDRLGASVAAGDFNNDGYDDLVAGAANQSRAKVYYGSASGLSNTVASTLSGEGGFGGGLSSSDFNGDGYADMLISAVNGASGAGMLYIFFGGASGLDTTAGVTITGGTGSGLGYYGSSGDFNGDGYADAIVSTNTTVVGYKSVYIYLGGANGMDGSPAVTISHEGDDFIHVSFGDFNNDGFADAVAGIFSTNGEVDIYTGRSDFSGAPSADVSITGGNGEAFGCGVSGGASP